MTIHWWRKREVGSEGKEGEGKGEEKEGVSYLSSACTMQNT